MESGEFDDKPGEALSDIFIATDYIHTYMMCIHMAMNQYLLIPFLMG